MTAMNKISESTFSISQYANKSIGDLIRKKLDKCGIFYRLFSRIKSRESIAKKLETKNYQGANKLQDILGVRIALYFCDDVSICKNILEKMFTVVDISEDEISEDVFRPTRLNYVVVP